MVKQKVSEATVIPTEEDLYKQIMLTNDTVWGNRLSKTDIEKWLLNFKGHVFPVDYERRLALYLLSGFVHYNEMEVRQLCKTLFNDYLHRMLLREDVKSEENVDATLDLICYTSRFYYLGKPGESGAFVLYFFRQANNIPVNYISDPTNLPVYIKNIVFVDDVTISGTQAIQYFRRHRDKGRKAILLTFLSTERATRSLKENDIEVISCIVLDDRSKCFSKNSNLFRDFKNDFQNCRKFAVEYGKRSLLYHPIDYGSLGYMNGQYAFGFFYNTPDNTLPIFWADNQSWTPIMRRFEKLSGDLHHEFRRFV